MNVLKNYVFDSIIEVSELYHNSNIFTYDYEARDERYKN